MKFAEFSALLQQLNAGTVSEIEFLLKVQLDGQQVVDLIAVQRLPFKLYEKMALADLDRDHALEIMGTLNPVND